MKISEELIRRLNEISQMRYPNEACGVLIGNNSNGQVESIWELENILESTHNFQIDSFDYLKVEKWAIARGKDIIGFFHSHPNDSHKIYQILFTRSTFKPETVRLVPQNRSPSGFLSCHSIL